MVSTNKHFQLSAITVMASQIRADFLPSKKTHFTLHYKKYLSGSNYLRSLVGDTVLNHYSDISDKQIV